MKNLMTKWPLLLAFFTVSALAETTIIKNEIDYARSLVPADRNGIPVYLAAVGGTVTFVGDGPVNVTIRIGGQDYTALTDQVGRYSFLVYANASSFRSEAWLPGQEPVLALNVTSFSQPSAAKKGL
jgi:hypothetical protein